MPTAVPTQTRPCSSQSGQLAAVDQTAVEAYRMAKQEASSRQDDEDPKAAQLTVRGANAKVASIMPPFHRECAGPSAPGPRPPAGES